MVSLFPRPTGQGLAFAAKALDLLVANAEARKGEHVLVIYEVNLADLARFWQDESR